MLQPRISTPLCRALLANPSICIRCQHQALRRPQLPKFALLERQFTSATILRLPAEKPQETIDAEPDTKFVPQPLGRPIGFNGPPRAGQNSGKREKKRYTGATMKERNLEKRKDIVEKWGQNYFRDFKNITKHRSGKTFVANPKIFKKEVSLYFPNLHGETLAESSADTTPVLQGKVSVVKVYSSQWGEGQAQSFTGEKENPELAQILKDNKDVAQLVDINVEENFLKAWLVALFKWNLRRQKSSEEWRRYFVVRKGVSDRIRETIGLLNGRVGYIYLVDENCKIRWAGSGYAEGTEKEDLVRGLLKMIHESKEPTARRSIRQPNTKTA